MKVVLSMIVLLMGINTADAQATRRGCYNKGPAFEWIWRNGRGKCVRMYGRGSSQRREHCAPGTRYRCGVMGCWCVPSRRERDMYRD